MVQGGKHIDKARKEWIKRQLGSLDVDPATRLKNGILTRLSSVNGLYVPLMPKVREATKEAIQTILTNGRESRLGIKKVVGQIAEQLAPYMVGRPAEEVEALAQSIAETESRALDVAFFLEMMLELSKIVEADHEKSWVVCGDNPCEKCRENQAVGWIPLDDEFPSGDMCAPAHSKCNCGLDFRCPSHPEIGRKD